jgi:hypothetical protein
MQASVELSAEMGGAPDSSFLLEGRGEETEMRLTGSLESVIHMNFRTRYVLAGWTGEKGTSGFLIY